MRTGLAVVIALLGSVPALSVSDEEIFRNFPFNLTNPGARALGVGGAFISLADDSTAAQANPAGLMNLRRPELFAELRAQNYDSSLTAAVGSLDGNFFRGELSAGAVSNPSSTLSPSFISYVYPLKRVALGISRLESLNIQTRTLTSFAITGQEAIIAPDVDGEPTIIGYQPVNYELTAAADVDAKVVQYNLALAVQAHRTFFLGATAVYGTADVSGRVDNLFIDRTSQPSEPFAFPTLDYSTRIDDSDSNWAYNAGLLWRPIELMSIGIVYRKGLQFVLEEQIPEQGVRAREAQNLFGTSFENVLHSPDSYGAGISFRPAEPWTILIDWVHMEYSDLMDGYISGLNRISFPSDRAEFTVDDGDEYHLGVERIFLAGTTPWALRFGAWSDPDHRIRATNDAGLMQVFPAGETLTHYTLGFGLTVKQSIQLDFAGDYSERSTAFVVSSIFGF
jgi:long-subunit fatty acid transport protein